MKIIVNDATLLLRFGQCEQGRNEGVAYMSDDAYTVASQLATSLLRLITVDQALVTRSSTVSAAYCCH